MTNAEKVILLVLIFIALGYVAEHAKWFAPEKKQVKVSAPTKTPQLKSRQEKKAVSPEVSKEITAGAIFETLRGPVGTVFLFERLGVFGGVSVADIYGPPGWNKGKTFRCNLHTLPGMSRDGALCWGFIPAITGTYTVKSWVRGQMQVEYVFINTEMRINAPRIIRIRSAPGGAVRVRWEASTDVQSFLLRVNPFPYTTGNITREIVLSGGIRSMSFTGLPLVRGKQYQVSLFAFSKNVRIPVSTRGSFNIGHQSLLFRAR